MTKTKVPYSVLSRNVLMRVHFKAFNLVTTSFSLWLGILPCTALLLLFKVAAQDHAFWIKPQAFANALLLAGVVNVIVFIMVNNFGLTNTTGFNPL